MSDLKARRGDIIMFSTGEYSDYGHIGHFVALEDITAKDFIDAAADAKAKEKAADAAYEAWAEKYEPTNGPPCPPGCDVEEAFIASLIKRGLLASIAVTEHHIGYSDGLHID